MSESVHYYLDIYKQRQCTWSKAIYYKEIGPDGSSVKAYKETYDPQGNLVHSKDKLVGTGGERIDD